MPESLSGHRHKAFRITRKEIVMITISGPASELKKFNQLFEDGDCKGFACTASEMQRCLNRVKNPCPCHMSNITFKPTEQKKAQVHSE